MNTVTLAFLGDAFYELAVRRRLAGQENLEAADKLHSEAVKYVRASSQAEAVREMLAMGALSSEELDVIRKARNRKPKSIPRNADPMDYKYATAFEALLGYHYTEGRIDRAEELAELAMRFVDNQVL